MSFNSNKTSNFFFVLFFLALQLFSVLAAPVALPVAAPVLEPIALPAPVLNNPTTLLGRIYHPAAKVNTARAPAVADIAEPIILREGDTSSARVSQEDIIEDALLSRADRFQRRMERASKRGARSLSASSENADSA
ncbi:hypothetical protein CPB84DRAFT_1828107 [Gymnopilus junonius]|uniref:Uncharacterized protein n=1 Tax=Gymnopilus junonius TaxID=109634 RepID=A0A9P5NDK6_GYMJU|nr:hypothetical protein CPB84DRAFT_1828107 [Gymnopilus junonius]